MLLLIKPSWCGKVIAYKNQCGEPKGTFYGKCVGLWLIKFLVGCESKSLQMLDNICSNKVQIPDKDWKYM